MESIDATVKIAREAGAKVFDHKRTGYVEPARNFAISKATGDWILILDADEEIGKELAKKLKELTFHPKADYYRLPRKNINFGKWIKNARWWPDYNIRFFKKGSVTWNELIHSVPMTIGKGMDLPAEERFSIIHHNYPTVTKYIDRMNRYSEIQADTLNKAGVKFLWQDLIRKPTAEFLSRYFAGEGYKDGVHGLALSLLQAFSELAVYLKLWQMRDFPEQAVDLKAFSEETEKSKREIKWWMLDARIKKHGFMRSIPLRILKRLNKK
jgi:(heptosyl)LPS beta-1,4-glucosyltransferase